MRGITIVCWLLIAALPAVAADDLLADLRAEIAAATATASLKSSTGVQAGSKVYATHDLLLKSDDCVYELAYKSFVPPNESRNEAELNDWSGGLGMIQPSDKGWYSNGFVTITLADAQGSQTTALHLATARVVQESGKTAGGELAWKLPNGDVAARFFIIAGRPELFLLVTAKPKDPQAHLEIGFQCYPGGFSAPRERWVHTARQAVQAAGAGLTMVKLDPAQERWMVLADHYAGLTARPMGPCAVAVDPQGLVAAQTEVRDNYSVRPRFIFAPGTTTALFALREFTPMPWQSAVDEISTEADAALAAGRAAASLAP